MLKLLINGPLGLWRLNSEGGGEDIYFDEKTKVYIFSKTKVYIFLKNQSIYFYFLFVIVYGDLDRNLANLVEQLLASRLLTRRA